MAHARAAIASKHLDEASAQFERMGITPTPDQLASAGEALLKTSQRERMAVARADRWKGHAESQRAADMEWACRQAVRYGDIANEFDPTIPTSAVFRLLSMALDDEAASPDGFSRTRFLKRLQAFVDRAKTAAEARSRELAGSLPDLQADL